MIKINENMTQAERAELWGRLIDVVEDWLEERGFSPKDFPNDDRNFPMDPDEDIIFGEDYDRLADNFAKVIGIARDCIAQTESEEGESWAEREVKLACKRENPDRKDGEWDYGCACYESALKAYKSLAEDGHSGFSIGLTKNILNRLIDQKPLTPIEDTEDVWNDISDISGRDGEAVNYQCKRMSSLFKYVYSDGTVKYKDVDRVVMVVEEDDGRESTWHSGLVSDIINELFPITMPYIPENNPYKVYCKECLSDKDNGDYDTVGIFYAITPDGTRVEINRFFREIDGEFKEIDESEYQKNTRKLKKGVLARALFFLQAYWKKRKNDENQTCLGRYMNCDWGDTTEDDKCSNNQALKNIERGENHVSNAKDRGRVDNSIM